MTLVAPGDLGTSLERLSAAKPSTVGPPLESRSTHSEELASKITGRWRETTQHMAAVRRSYWINLAFYLGQQWIWWSDQRNQLQRYQEPVQPLSTGRVRLTVNRYGPNIDNVLGRLARSELAFDVPPTDGSDPVVQGAQRSEKLLEAKRVEQRWDAVRYDQLFATLMGGTSGVAVEWDAKAGDPLPQFHDQTDQYLGTGDCSLRAYNVTEFGLEPGARSHRDANWWIAGVAMPCATAQEHYDLNWLPRSDAATQGGPLYDSMLTASGRLTGKDLCLVLTYYERPARRSPGMYVVVINGVVVHETPKWPFPFPELNLHLYRQRPIDGRWLGATYATDAVNVQVAYNHARSVISEHLKLAGNARLLAPFGSIHEEDLYSAAGELLYYSPDGSGSAPAYLVPPNLPRWVVTEADTLREELDNTMQVHDISRGVGFSRASGQALAFLAQQDDSSFSRMVWESKQGWEDVASQVLRLYGENATETRTMQISVAKGITESTSWNGRSLQKQYRAVVPIDAVTPKNEAARLANAKDLWDRKIITDPRKYARMAGIPPEDFGQLLDPDADKANRENLRMAMGMVEVPAAFDDHAVHIAEHNDRLRKTDAYQYAPSATRSIIDDHIKYHQNMAANEMARQTAIEQAVPGGAATPQADAPPGSDVPQSEQEQQGRLGAMAQMGMTPSGGSTPGGAVQPGASQPAGAQPLPGGGQIGH